MAKPIEKVIVELEGRVTALEAQVKKLSAPAKAQKKTTKKDK